MTAVVGASKSKREPFSVQEPLPASYDEAGSGLAP